jgi:FixJ family two-component response regulator
LSELRDVVVVDDDPSMLAAIERLLRANGFNVRAHESAEALRAHGSLNNAVCLVLDINLGAESGLEVRRRLRRSGVSLPVIFITASDRDETREAAIDAGCLAYLRKPFSGQSLVDAVREASLMAQ